MHLLVGDVSFSQMVAYSQADCFLSTQKVKQNICICSWCLLICEIETHLFRASCFSKFLLLFQIYLNQQKSRPVPVIPVRMEQLVLITMVAVVLSASVLLALKDQIVKMVHSEFIAQMFYFLLVEYCFHGNIVTVKRCEALLVI